MVIQLSGRWFGTWIPFFHMGLSSSQLTFTHSIIFQRGWNSTQPPTSYGWFKAPCFLGFFLGPTMGDFKPLWSSRKDLDPWDPCLTRKVELTRLQRWKRPSSDGSTSIVAYWFWRCTSIYTLVKHGNKPIFSSEKSSINEPIGGISSKH